MTVRKLEINELLAFEKLSLEFSPGINVLIGENSTGKTQVMKLAYAMLRSLEDYQREKVLGSEKSKPHITDKLNRVFRPDNDRVGRLVHRGRGRNKGSAKLYFGEKGYFTVSITTLDKVVRGFKGASPPAIFIPSREVLAIFPGFTSAYENRELSFDETYYDICKLLSATQLRGPRGQHAQELIEPLLQILGGRIEYKDGRFALQMTKLVGSGTLEAPLLSEGFRKLGSLVQLIANGALAKHSILFWDEPEASLNPKLVTVVSKMLQSLARQGIQIFIATHDFLLTQELSLAAEHEPDTKVPMRFFALSRKSPGESVTVQSDKTLVGLRSNPILEEFAAHYDREQRMIALIASKMSSGEGRK